MQYEHLFVIRVRALVDQIQQNLRLDVLLAQRQFLQTGQIVAAELAEEIVERDEDLVAADGEVEDGDDVHHDAQAGQVVDDPEEHIVLRPRSDHVVHERAHARREQQDVHGVHLRELHAHLDAHLVEVVQNLVDRVVMLDHVFAENHQRPGYCDHQEGQNVNVHPESQPGYEVISSQ